MTNTHYVFVYGTLRKGESNHFLLRNASCLLEKCWTKGALYDSGLGYPAVKHSQETIVYGELYKVTEDELKQLDILEDFEEGRTSNLYDRVIQTIYSTSNSYEAFIYIAKEQSLLKKRITSGDWSSYSFNSFKCK